MPQCNKCAHVAATSEFRRSPKGGYICRDKDGCKHDRRLRAKGQEPGPRSLQALLRF
jgi:hypothetical protein